MPDIRKPFLKSFTVKELMQFIDYYIDAPCTRAPLGSV